jgi:alkylhydroperoxidase/carboxymuconolactone decarboxylase family protein YurZ
MPTETPVLDLMAGMTELSLEATTLDDRDVMLARIAALVASDAPPISYTFNLGAAAGVVTGDEIRGVVAAIAPIVGTSRVATAMGNVVKALAIEELAELDAEAMA